MTSRAAKQLTTQVQQQCRKWLQTFPAEKGNSIGFVSKRLKPVHAEAAIWMKENRGMALNTHNFHNLIVQFRDLRALATLIPSGAMVNFSMDMQPSPGEFHPAHLVEYFIWLDSGCPVPVPQIGLPADQML